MARINKRTTGIYRKFNVFRTDERDAPGKKHDGCEYFVLDLTHDRFAPAAIKAYAHACRNAYPMLSCDLINKLIKIEDQRWRKAHPRDVAVKRRPMRGPAREGRRKGA